jgi:hypothetical protein
MHSPSMHDLLYVSLVTAVIDFIEVTHLALAHSSISFNCSMSHQSESSTDAIHSRYAMRDRRNTTQMLIALSLQDDELDQIDEDTPDSSDDERDLAVLDDDSPDPSAIHDEDSDDDTWNVYERADDTTLVPESAAPVVLPSPKQKKSPRKRTRSDDDDEWSTEVKDIVLPIRRFHQPKQHADYSKLSSLQILQLLLSTTVIDAWSAYTNEHASKHGVPNLNVTANELYAFIAAHVYMAIDHLPELSMYWSQSVGHPFIQSLFTRDRFKLILANFCITRPVTDDNINNPEYHTSTFISYLNETLPKLHKPSQALTFDESMAAFKGRSSIRQYIPSKPHKWGYKIFCLASDNYLLRLELYAGADDSESEHGKTYDLVVRMLKDYVNQSHVLFIDNFFTSPTLMMHLHSLGIAVCGSVRLNRRGMPPSSQLNERIFRRMGRGDSMHLQEDSMCLVVWKDQNVMKVLYNHIQPNTRASTLKRWGDDGRKFDLACPQAIKDYFYNARDVDVIGQLHYSYPAGRKAKRSSPRLVWWLIDICIVAVYVLWSMSRESSTQLDFRIQLMHELAALWLKDRTEAEKRGAVQRGVALAKDHYSERTEVVGDCVVCSVRPSNRKQVKFICATCKVHLCIGKCFATHHK